MTAGLIQFARSNRWRLSLLFFLALVVLVGDWALRLQQRTLDLKSISSDGGRVVAKVVDGHHAGGVPSDSYVVADRNGRVLHRFKTDGFRWVKAPLLRANGKLVGVGTIAHKWHLLQYDVGDRRVDSLCPDASSILELLETDSGNLVHLDRVERSNREFVTLHENVARELLRLEIGVGEDCAAATYRALDGQLRVVFDVWPLYSGRVVAENEYEITDGSSPIRMILNPETGTVEEEFQLSQSRIQPRSPNHVFHSVKLPGQKRMIEVHRRGDAAALFTMPSRPKWLEGDTFYKWDYGGSAILVYEPRNEEREFACEPLGQVLPGVGSEFFVTTELGKLQLYDAKSGFQRTLINARTWVSSLAMIAAVGFPLFICAWLTLAWRESTSPEALNDLLPLTNALLLFAGLAFGFSIWSTSAGELGETSWGKWLLPSAGVSIWTMLTCIAVLAANCRWLIGHGGSILIGSFAVTLFCFKRWYSGGNASEYINGAALYVICLTAGCLFMRRRYGRFRSVGAESQSESNTVQRISLLQLVIATCCFAALFSVMRRYGIWFTLSLDWGLLLTPLAMSAVVLTALWASLRINNPWLMINLIVGSTVVVSGVYWFAMLVAQTNVWMDLVGIEFFYWDLVSSWRPDRSSSGWWMMFVQSILPASFAAFVCRICRKSGMSFSQ